MSHKCEISFIGLKSTSNPCPPREVSPVKILAIRGDKPNKKPAPPNPINTLVSRDISSEIKVLTLLK
jgi:hypothetical protein